MKLTNFFNSLDVQSDKGTLHDYINGYYNQEFSPKQDKSIKLLEIGVGQGHSLYLWKNFFSKGKVIGIENNPELIPLFIKPEWMDWVDSSQTNATILINDAYSNEVIEKFKDEEFDYIIDDGPHTLETQLIFIQKYLNKVKTNGKLIIEDIQSEEILNELIKETQLVGMEYKAFDLRNNKNRYDDIILEITKK